MADFFVMPMRSDSLAHEPVLPGPTILPGDALLFSPLQNDSKLLIQVTEVFYRFDFPAYMFLFVCCYLTIVSMTFRRIERRSAKCKSACTESISMLSTEGSNRPYCRISSPGRSRRPHCQRPETRDAHLY